MGVTLDKRITLIYHMEKLVGRFQAAIRMLYALICQSSKGEIRAAYTYAPPAIMEIEASHFQKLQLQQNKILKTMLNLMWRYPRHQLHADGIELVKDFCSRLCDNFF